MFALSVKYLIRYRYLPRRFEEKDELRNLQIVELQRTGKPNDLH